MIRVYFTKREGGDWHRATLYELRLILTNDYKWAALRVGRLIFDRVLWDNYSQWKVWPFRIAKYWNKV